MSFNKSFDNSENASNVISVLEQIKKRTEEISTSEASIKFLSNLSNPTNLTNPLIINSLSKRNQEEKKFKLPSLKSRRVIMKIKNEMFQQKLIPKSNSNILSRNQNISFFSENFDLKNYQNLFEKAEKDLLDIREKKRFKNILQKLNRENDISKNDISNNINNGKNDNSINNSKIWEKLKHSNSYIGKIDKDARINYFKFIPKKKAIEKSNNIRLLHYIQSNKNEHYKKFLSMKKAELKTTNNMMKKIQKSKDFLQNKFDEQYKSYARFLYQTYEKENTKNDELIKKKLLIMKDINKLKMNIEKIKNNKRLILDWIYLQIRIYKKTNDLPIYYKQILEDNISYKNINRINIGKCYLDIKEYNEIVNYKNKLLYENVEDMVQNIKEYQIISLNKNREDPDSFILQQSMNSELKELIKQNEKDEEIFNEKYNKLFDKLEFLKAINKNLKIKFIQAKTKKVKLMVYKDKLLINKFSLYSIINVNQNLLNFIQTNNKSTLFNLSLCLYQICSIYNYNYTSFDGSNIKFNLDLDNKTDEENMFMIFKKASLITDLLKQEKKNYFSDKISRAKYIKIKYKVDKESIKERTKAKIDMQKNANTIKIEKLKERVNKKYFKRLNKVDYFKAQRKSTNQSLDLENNGRTKFEDFFSDIES